MANKNTTLKQREILQQKNHMPEDTFLFEKAIPILLVGLVVVTVGFIVFSLGIFFGYIQF